MHRFAVRSLTRSSELTPVNEQIITKWVGCVVVSFISGLREYFSLLMQALESVQHEFIIYSSMGAGVMLLVFIAAYSRKAGNSGAVCVSSALSLMLLMISFYASVKDLVDSG